MRHQATPKFWIKYALLPSEIQQLADKNFTLLKSNPAHPSLAFKPVPGGWSVRIGLHYRAIAVKDSHTYHWIWIGHHTEYDRILAGK